LGYNTPTVFGTVFAFFDRFVKISTYDYMFKPFGSPCPSVVLLDINVLYEGGGEARAMP